LPAGLSEALGGEHAVSGQENGANRRESELLSSLIGDIYDTTLDRSLWPATLKKIAAFVRGASAAVFWDDAAGGGGDVYFEDGGIDPIYRDLYFEKFVKFNPTTTPRFFAQTEMPVATGDLVPYDEFLTTRFYREWAQPQGLVDFASITLEKSVTKSAMFGVFRHQRHGLVDEEMRRQHAAVGTSHPASPRSSTSKRPKRRCSRNRSTVFVPQYSSSMQTDALFTPTLPYTSSSTRLTFCA
jgi:hypothetical protein